MRTLIDVSLLLTHHGQIDTDGIITAQELRAKRTVHKPGPAYRPMEPQAVPQALRPDRFQAPTPPTDRRLIAASLAPPIQERQIQPSSISQKLGFGSACDKIDVSNGQVSCLLCSRLTRPRRAASWSLSHSGTDRPETAQKLVGPQWRTCLNRFTISTYQQRSRTVCSSTSARSSSKHCSRRSTKDPAKFTRTSYAFSRHTRVSKLPLMPSTGLFMERTRYVRF